MSASRFAESAEHSVTCPVCFEFYADPHLPKNLECPHTCCQVCLQNIVTLNPGQPITCPEKCEQKTRVPAGGVEELRTNFHVKHLAEEHPNYVKDAKPAVPKCAKHGEKMHLFCTLCEKLECHICGMAYHKSSEHAIVDVSDKVEDQKKELKSVTENTMKEIQSCKNDVAELKTVESNIDRQLDDEITKLTKSAEMCISAIHNERKRLELELKRASEEKLRKIRVERTRAENHTSQLQDSYDVAIKVGDMSDHAYITQHKDLVEGMKKSIVVENTSPQIDMKLQSAKFEAVVTSATFGRIVKQVQQFGDFNFAVAVGSSKNGLLAVSDRYGKQVSIYEKHNDKYEMNISLELNTKNAGNPRGVKFCPDGKILVARMTGIEVYSPGGKYEKTISSVQDDESNAVVGVCSLGITEDGRPSRILAGDFIRSIITIHDTAGKIIRTMKTNFGPCTMDVIRNTHVAISDWNPGKISVINMETGYETMCVDVPWVNAICYDTHTDSIFSGSTDNNGSLFHGTGKIEQYCWRTGRKIACIAQELYHPTAMTMASDNTLVVADHKSVKIFEIA